MKTVIGVVLGLALVVGCNADDDQEATEATGGQPAAAGASGEAGHLAGLAGAVAAGGAGGAAGSASAGRFGVAGGAPGCGPLPLGGAGGSAGGNALSIVGDYTDDYGGTHVISPSTWTQFGVFEITQFSNEAGWVVARSAATNDYNPCLWSRFDFARYDGELYFCQGTFDAASEADALEAPAPDASDPTAGGCGDYPWSKLTPQ